MESSKSKGSFYITTTLPYVNAAPHIGHAVEFIRADVIARYKKIQGFEVFFNTGTDEHGLKIYREAVKEGKAPQDYVDGYARKFRSLETTLGLSEDMNFIRTTDPHHMSSAQAFWKICAANTDEQGQPLIYKKSYEVKYCVGCELEKTNSELVDGKCPIHPNIELEYINEENYFFRFSSFQKRLLKLYDENSDFVIPEFRFREIKSFVSQGLEDFSISRLKAKMPWGVPVPDDEGHVMYVWFDALVNYISALGWPEDKEKFEKFWKNGTPVQFCGKDNLRQQSAMWQAMLMATDLPPTKHIIIDGFVTGEGGMKMSKSLGNTVNPIDIVNEYGTDALRYFVLREIHPFEDSPFTSERFKESYNANLANGLGNLVSRVIKMAETNGVSVASEHEAEKNTSYGESLTRFDIKQAADEVWNLIQSADRHIQATEPFKLVKTDLEAGKKEIESLLVKVLEIASLLEPLMPSTSAKIKVAVKGNKLISPLFPRKE